MRTRTVTCDQCDILVINNVVCHEHGCPNVDKPQTARFAERNAEEAPDDDER